MLRNRVPLLRDPQGSGLWTPAQLGAGTIEYDARAGVTEVSGKASQWDDNIGSVDAVQATAGARPSLGPASLIFPSGTALTAAMPQPNFLEGCYAVCRLGSYTGRGVLLGAQAGGRIFYLTGASTNQLTISVDRQSFIGGPTRTVTVPSTTDPYIIGIGATWPGQEFSFNGDVTTGSAGDPGFNVFDTSVGGGGYGNTVSLYLHHLVRTPAKLDTTNRQLLEGYFAHSWDATLSSTALRDGLPVGHPYKSSPPMLAALSSSPGPRINVGGTWKSSTVYVKQSGIWKQATVSVKQSGTWKPLI